MGAQEGSVIRDYIDEVLSLPWGEYSKESNSLEKAEKILNRDHYGLEKVKERILEFLAVKLSSSSAGGSIPVSYTHLDVYKRQALCTP